MPIPQRRVSTKRCILVVEPHPEVRDFLQEVLEIDGYQVVTAPNGTKAREVILRQRLDAALIEVMLGDESGTVLGSDLDAAGVPVLMMTGHSDGLRLLDSLSLRRIHKPFRSGVLSQSVEEIVSDAEVRSWVVRHEC